MLRPKELVDQIIGLISNANDAMQEIDDGESDESLVGTLEEMVAEARDLLGDRTEINQIYSAKRTSAGFTFTARDGSKFRVIVSEI